MTLHKLTAGNGYTYLTRQVAANDGPAVGHGSLAEYYSERGESPGVWLGRGLADLPDGPTLGERVLEEQMVALFGHGRHPNAAAVEQRAVLEGTAVALTELGRPFKVRAGSTPFRRQLAQRIIEHNQSLGQPGAAPVSTAVRARLRTELGRSWFVRDHGQPPADARELSDFLTRASRPGPSSVAGYDLAFSPVKSVSALWALAGPEVAAQVERAHDAAVRDVVGWLEDTAVFTRLGRNGTRQVDVGGLLAVAFVHRDSRAGDPDLHTHVAISNKVRTPGGRWLALDGRVLHKAAVSASERYNTRLEAQLVDRLGVEFADRPTERGKRPVREIVGLEPALLQVWSSRRRAVTERQALLAADFSRRHGRQPDAAETHDLFNQATIATRPGKHGPRALDEQRACWRQEAAAVLGGDSGVDHMLAIVTGGAARTPVAATVSLGWSERAGRRAVATVSSTRATWQVHHLRAEVERIARADGIPLVDLDAQVGAAVEAALSPAVSMALGAGRDDISEPPGLRRKDGSSVFTVAGAQLYTSARVLDAERRLLAAANRMDGRRATDGLVELSFLEARAGGQSLNAQQEQLVRDLATSGRRLQLALAPAGTGKTTALGALACGWREDGGNVVGLAPSAAAAAELRTALGAATDTVAKLLHGIEAGRLDGGMDDIDARTLVVIDEAGTAGTFDLDRVVAYVLQRGGSARLVGDTRQLAAVGSGGVLRDIARAQGAATLDTPVRFVDPVEGHASLALRTGDPIALGYYLDHDRVHAGDRSTIIETAFAAWRADVAAGRESVLLAATNDTVRDLNARARAGRLTNLPAGVEVRLHDGSSASAGDIIVTRRNDRRLPITSTDWVKNGDRWRVVATADDGALHAMHLASRRLVRLPKAYVEQHVELGYATTIHLAQGRTSDTCHAVLSGRESREDLYVAMTRGRVGNHMYVDTSAPGPHDATTPEAIRPPTSVEVLERVLARGSERHSATSQHALDIDAAHRLRHAAERYREAVTVAGSETSVAPGPLP
ncbi:MAG: relaxase domain-containing protein, partial [Actinomycetota bacterium]|nr:relaxase domain-containing protein [Actinomycetota bacterium]